MSKKLNISVLVAARDEYIEQLKCIISPLLIQGVNSIYGDALKASNGNKTIYQFQELLQQIPNWNQTILEQESNRMKKKCNYMMDIVTAIFVSNVKILASIRLKGNNDNIKVKIPTSDIFIHSIYLEAAQQIFYDPYLFYHKSKDIQKNKKTVKEIICNSIDETIRKMLPFDDILQEYLANALDNNIEGGDSSSDSDDSERELRGNRIVNASEGSESDYSDESDKDEVVKNFNINENGSTTFEQPVQSNQFMGGIPQPESNILPPQSNALEQQPPPPPPQEYQEQIFSKKDDSSSSSSDSDTDSDSSSRSHRKKKKNYSFF